MLSCEIRAVLVAALGVNCAAPLSAVEVSGERAIVKRAALVETRVAAAKAISSLDDLEFVHNFDADQSESASEQQHSDGRRGPHADQLPSRPFNRLLLAALLGGRGRVRCLLVDRLLLLLIDLLQRLAHSFQVELSR